MKALLTTSTVLNKNYILGGEDIIIKYNNRIKKLATKGRKFWSNSKLNYTCIEINDQDNIENFYRLDEDLIHSFQNNDNKHKSITLFGLIENKKPALSS